MANDNHGAPPAFDVRTLTPYADAAGELVADMRNGAEVRAEMDDGREVTLGAADRHYLSGVRDMLLVLTGALSESGDMMATPALAAVRARMLRNEFGDDD